MNKRKMAVPLVLAAAWAAAGCGQQETRAEGAPSSATASNAAWTQGGGPPADRSDGHGTARWIAPENIDMMRKDAAFIGVVRVEAVRSGAPLRTPQAPDVAPIATQIVEMSVLKGYKGQESGRVNVFKTGTNDRWIEQDPPYVEGQVYLLYATRRDDGLLLPTGPTGRFEVRDNKLRPFDDGPIGKSLENRSPEDGSAITGQNEGA